MLNATEVETPTRFRILIWIGIVNTLTERPSLFVGVEVTLGERLEQLTDRLPVLIEILRIVRHDRTISSGFQIPPGISYSVLNQ
ncbi:hypothetical protein ACFQFH_03240 [Halobaculum halobium]|uniref:Uncharacterized protein n=1 Tax=Halobaculum halobium TaxID=3032281 RepID=A0ABD5TB60_9EURY|nr:hypothetical protein [Halobaculum sp. SYNS20]